MSILVIGGDVQSAAPLILELGKIASIRIHEIDKCGTNESGRGINLERVEMVVNVGDDCEGAMLTLDLKTRLVGGITVLSTCQDAGCSARAHHSIRGATWLHTNAPTKVDSWQEIIAVAKALAARSNSKENIRSWHVGPWEFNFTHDGVELNQEDASVAVSLSKTESKILRLLCENMGQCLGREDFKQAVWGGARVVDKSIDVHVSRLRRKFEEIGISIENVYGRGYVLAVES